MRLGHPARLLPQVLDSALDAQVTDNKDFDHVIYLFDHLTTKSWHEILIFNQLIMCFIMYIHPFLLPTPPSFLHIL